MLAVWRDHTFASAVDWLPYQLFTTDKLVIRKFNLQKQAKNTQHNIPLWYTP